MCTCKCEQILKGLISGPQNKHTHTPHTHTHTHTQNTQDTLRISWPRAPSLPRPEAAINSHNNDLQRRQPPSPPVPFPDLGETLKTIQPPPSPSPPLSLSLFPPVKEAFRAEIPGVYGAYRHQFTKPPEPCLDLSGLFCSAHRLQKQFCLLLSKYLLPIFTFVTTRRNACSKLML